MSIHLDELGEEIKKKLQESKGTDVYIGATDLRQLFWLLINTRQTKKTFNLMDSIKERLPSLFGK